MNFLILFAVGYGDMGPTTAGCRLFTVFYSLFAIMAAAPSLGLIMSYFQEHRSENDVAVRVGTLVYDCTGGRVDEGR